MAVNSGMFCVGRIERTSSAAEGKTICSLGAEAATCSGAEEDPTCWSRGRVTTW
jgi:hypothetical protein